MELEVLQHQGLPETGVLSVRAGGTRRQVQLKDLDRPLKFPCTPEDNPAFKVDLLNHMGSGRLAYSETTPVYVLPLEPPEGTEAAAQMEVTFSVRRLGEGGDVSDTPASPSRTLDEKALDKKREAVAREYLESHGLLNFMQFLMQSLMKDKPTDPYAFLQKQVTKRMVSESAKQVATALEAMEQEALPKSVVDEVSPEACMVAPEQLTKLQDDAAAAGEQLRQDNQKLREMADHLRLRYQQLIGQPLVPPEQAREDQPSLPPPGKDTPQLSAYRDIAQLQDEITALAKENSQLVTELSEMRQALDSVSRDIVAAGDAVVDAAE